MTGPHLTLTTAGAWVDEALCAQVDAAESFFPEKGMKNSVKEAKAVCKRCPVIEECLKHAMTTHENYGIWGGHTERERRVLRSKARPTDAVCDDCGKGFANAMALRAHLNGRGACATKRKAVA